MGLVLWALVAIISAILAIAAVGWCIGKAVEAFEDTFIERKPLGASIRVQVGQGMYAACVLSLVILSPENTLGILELGFILGLLLWCVCSIILTQKPIERWFNAPHEAKERELKAEAQARHQADLAKREENRLAGIEYRERQQRFRLANLARARASKAAKAERRAKAKAMLAELRANRRKD